MAVWFVTSGLCSDECTRSRNSAIRARLNDKRKIDAPALLTAVFVRPTIVIAYLNSARTFKVLFNNDQLDELLELGQGDVAEFCDSYFNVVTLSKHMERMEPSGCKDLCGT